ncbi:PAS domain-containing protein, partial [Skermanella stibiiresistens]|uniref:PAS domain-containing protein n=1 Tax=Skermanella stibiiresistens TaxID=913326 RepID=UPI0012FADFCA
MLKEARTVTAMIERDMRGVMAMLETLALMPALQRRDFATFHQQASQITKRYGIGIVLADGGERQRLNTRVPWNTPLPPFFDDDIARAVMETKTPYVTDVEFGPVARAEVVGILVPVPADGAATQVLAASLPVGRFRDILVQTGIASDRGIAVVDRDGRPLAVIPGDGPPRRGDDPPAWIKQAVGRDGVITAGEGGVGERDVISGASRSAMTEWTALVSLPGDAVDARVARELLAPIGLGLALLALSAALAYVFGLRIARAARVLTVAGNALQGGHSVPPIRTTWREANEVGQALTTAFSRLNERTAALRAAEERYHTLASSSPVGIFRTDAEGRCVGVNRRWCEIAGARPEQALGNGWTEFLHPEDHDVVFQEWRHAALENRPFRLEYRFRAPDGAITWVLGEALVERTASGDISGFVGTITDITANKALERQLRDAEEQLTRALAAGRMFAFDWHLETDTVRQSDGAAPILGPGREGASDPAGITSHAFFERVHPEDRERFVDTLIALDPGTPNYTIAYRYQRGDGSTVWLEESAAAIFDDDGRMVRLTGVTADVTERKTAEDILRGDNAMLEARVVERTRALTDAALELSAEIRRREEAQAALLQSQKLEALGQLVSGVSHDFNNILAVIQSSYNLLRRRTITPEEVKIIDLGEQAVTRATGLIHHLLAFARREESRPTVVDIKDILRESEEMICHTAGPLVRCRFDLATDLWPVIVDPSRLNAVLLNLAANARDAMPKGGDLVVTARNQMTGAQAGSAAAQAGSAVAQAGSAVAQA